MIENEINAFFFFSFLFPSFDELKIRQQCIDIVNYARGQRHKTRNFPGSNFPAQKVFHDRPPKGLFAKECVRNVLEL